MKKVYVKPMIQFENFKLTSSIAGDCEDLTSNPTVDACPVTVPGYYPGSTLNMFLTSVTACTTVAPDGDNGVCYHVPTEASNLFNS